LAKRFVKKRQSRAEQTDEANALLQSLLTFRHHAGNLTVASAKKIEDKSEAAVAVLDLFAIARCLAGGDTDEIESESMRYEHHFIGDKNREIFFSKLRLLTRQVASDWFFKMGQGAESPEKLFDWDPTLLPQRIAHRVVRLAILHPGVLEYFLPRFFAEGSELRMPQSTFRRAVLILTAVPWLGWSAEKHTEMLLECGAIADSKDTSAVETVKKFIRDLRRRYRKDVQRRRRLSTQNLNSPVS